jgi:hypothetical protein
VNDRETMQELMSALRAIRICLKADCGEVGEYWTARQWLRDHNRYEGNLQDLAVPLEVAEVAIRIGEMRPV